MKTKDARGKRKEEEQKKLCLKVCTYYTRTQIHQLLCKSNITVALVIKSRRKNFKKRNCTINFFLILYNTYG